MAWCRHLHTIKNKFQQHTKLTSTCFIININIYSKINSQTINFILTEKQSAIIFMHQ